MIGEIILNDEVTVDELKESVAIFVLDSQLSRTSMESVELMRLF